MGFLEEGITECHLVENGTDRLFLVLRPLDVIKVITKHNIERLILFLYNAIYVYFMFNKSPLIKSVAQSWHNDEPLYIT